MPSGQQFYSGEQVWPTDAVVLGDVGYLRVLVSGVDVTFFRGIPVRVVEYGSAEPFGDDYARIVMPQITGYDTFGANPSGSGDAADEDLSWLVDGANVDIEIVTGTAGSTQILEDTGTWRDNTENETHPVWQGFVASMELEANEDENVGLTLECWGSLYQLDLYVRAPKHLPQATNTAEFIAEQFDHATRPALRTAAATVVGSPAFTTRETGAWQPVLTGYIAEQLPRMVESDGTMWTVHSDRDRKPIVRTKNLATTHYSVSLNVEGVSHRLRRPVTERPNTIYGEGQDRQGHTWRNASILDSNGQTTYDPIGIDPEVDPDDANFDGSKLRVERQAPFGPGVDLDTAITEAQRVVDRDIDPGWIGDLILRTDPEEGSRWMTIARHNILLKHWQGTGSSGQLFHVTAVRHEPENFTTTMMVDTNGRDRQLIEALLEANREVDPITGRLRVGETSGVDDDLRPWDVEAGAGYIPQAWRDTPATRIALTASTWSITPILVREKGSVRITEMRMYDAGGDLNAVPFHMSVFDREVAAADLPSDPLAAGAWDFTAEGSAAATWEDALVIGYGQDGERAGFWPGFDSDGDSATGVLKDETEWEFETFDEGETRLWVALWTTSSGVEAQGRLFPGAGGV